MKEVPRGTSFKKSDLSLVHIFFEDLKVFKYHTDELFSWENILGEQWHSPLNFDAVKEGARSRHVPFSRLYSLLRWPHRPLHRLQLLVAGRAGLLLHPALHNADLQEEEEARQSGHARRRNHLRILRVVRGKGRDARGAVLGERCALQRVRSGHGQDGRLLGSRLIGLIVRMYYR